MLLACAIFVATGSYAQIMGASVRARMYEAATRGDVTELRRLVSLGYSLEMMDEYGNTPYCEAIWSQDRLAVSTLISVGVDTRPRCLNKIRHISEAQIYSAAHRENLKQLVAWKKEGLNIDVEDEKTKNSALCEAVYRSDCPAIQTLLRAGSKQAQPCMRRIPKKVRENLDCRPLKIDWATIGYTTLGIGVAGGLIALFGGHGGNGTPVCKPYERWNGELCMTCATCWIGNRCVTSAEQAEHFYYPEETTKECWTVAPPPRKLTDEQLTAKAAEIADEDEYKKGGFLTAINAATAYARGYSGYMVERTSPWGRLKNGQAGPDDPLTSVSDKKINIAIVSSGMNIGNGGKEKTTSSSSSNQREVWDWNEVHKNFYDSSEVGQMDYTPYGVNGYVSTPVGSIVGEVDHNFMVGSSNTPIGYNFDYGPCLAAGSGGQWKNCYGPTKNDFSEWDDQATTDAMDVTATDAFLGFYDQNGSVKFFTIDESTGSVFERVTKDKCKTAAEGDQNKPCALWVGSENQGFKKTVFEYYDYDEDYVRNESDPSVHYHSADGETWDKGDNGTFLAGIVGAMKDQGEIYGVAYNSAILPVISDLIYGVRSSEIEKLVNTGINVLLYADVFRSTSDASTAKGGGFTVSGNTYTPKSMDATYGSDFKSGIDKVAEKKVVFVMPTGNENYSQPSLEAVFPLTSDYNYVGQNKTWELNTALPNLDAENPLKNLFIVVASLDASGSLASNTQKCGVAASYCLSAPGGSNGNPTIYSAVSPDNNDTTQSYSTYGGTKAAAAVVSGAVALLMGAYPHLTSQQVVEILFKTATYKAGGAGSLTGSDDLGQYNSVYGRGVINLAAATQPVGGKEGLWVNNSGTAGVGAASGVVTAASTSIVSSASISPNLATGLPTNFVAFDYYNRPFSFPTNELFKQQKYRKTKSFNDFKLFMRGRDPIRIEPNDQFSMSYRQTISTRASTDLPMGLMEVNLKRKKMSYSLFYTEDTQLGRREYWKRKLSNPFVQMHNAYGIESKYQMNSKWSVEAGWTMGRNGFYDEQDRHFDAPDNKMQSFTSSLVYKPIDKLAFKVATGVMKETGSSLGMISSGAFNIKGANTYFMGAGVSISPIDKIRLEAMYYYG